MSSPAGWRIGLGPVFAYEWLTSSRRWQGYALRAVFLLFLLFALVVIWNGPRQGSGPSLIAALAALGQAFFIGVVGTQLTLVLLIAPAATAGAICLDRARGTLAHMLMTDLSNAEIVLGKLAARLVPVLGLVGCTLPLLAIMTLLGGVDPNALLGAFLVTLGIGLLGCSLALLFSVWAGKTHDALLATYAVLGLWLLLRHMARGLSGMVGFALPIPLATTDPYLLSFAPYWAPGSVSWSSYAWFLGVTSALSIVLVALAVWRVRAVCTREVVRRKKASRLSARWRELRQFLHDRLPAPALDFNPVFWRERHRARPSRWARLVGGLYVAIATVFSFGAMTSQSAAFGAWVNGLQVAAGLLFLSVGAATSLAEERVRGSLDILMTTRLSTAEIVLGKWLGTYRFVPFLAVAPALVVVSYVWNNPYRWPYMLMLVAYVLCSGGAIVSLGLAMATWFSRLGRAVGATVAVYIVITVGWLFLIMALSRMGPRVEGLMMASPFFCAGNMTFELGNTGPRLEMHRDWVILWTAAAASAAVLFLLVTLVNFDRLLGRVEGPFLTLLNGQLTPRRRVLIGAFIGLAAAATAAGVITDAPMAFLLNGAQVSVGFLLAAALAALAAADERRSGGFDRARHAGMSVPRTVLAMWLGCHRLIGPAMLLAAVPVFVHLGADKGPLGALVLLVCYLVCASAAWCAFGLVMGLWFSPRFAVLATAVFLALVLSLLPVASWWISGSWSPQGIWAVSPLLCVATTGMSLDVSGFQPWISGWWVINWAVFYVLAALLLFAVAAKTLERGLGGEWRLAMGGPAEFHWHRRPPPERKPAVEAWHE
jgi:ABC-type transport system involved in multi-copper enzyme maturation permease subunit